LGGSETALAMRIGGSDEGAEQRMRFHRFGLELGMELAAEEPGMIGDFADLHVGSVGRLAGDTKSRGLQRFLVLAVEFEAVAVTLADLARSVSLPGEAAFGQDARPRAQTHGAAELVDTFQFAEFEDDAMRCGGIEFGGIGAIESSPVPGELDHQGLHTEADAEVGNLMFASETNGANHAFDAALAKAAGNQDAVVAFQLPLPIVSLPPLGFNPVDLKLQAVSQRAMDQRFFQALIGILVL